MEYLKKCGLSLLIGYIILFILFMITSIIFAYTNIQDKYLDIAIYICLGIAAFASSMILGIKIKKRGAVLGLILGILFYGLIFLISIILGGFNFSTYILIYFAISIFCSLIGSIIGVNI